MCTVSIINLHDAAGAGAGPVGYRMVVNRDEHRDRAIAIPPRWHEISRPGGGVVRAIFPLDPAGGGTWVALSEAGLMMCLLNRNDLPRPKLPDPRTLISRGRIIPQLIGHASAAEALAALREMNLRAMAPFRLLAVDPPHAGGSRGAEGLAPFVASWDLRELRIEPLAAPPLCLVSSGLGDVHVQPRLGLFREMVGSATGAAAIAQQDRFHRHVWPDRPEISVLMSRCEARTVSILTAEVRVGASVAQGGEGAAEMGGAGAVGGMGGVTVHYEPIPELAPVLPVAAHARIAAG